MWLFVMFFFAAPLDVRSSACPLPPAALTAGEFLLGRSGLLRLLRDAAASVQLAVDHVGDPLHPLHPAPVGCSYRLKAQNCCEKAGVYGGIKVR
jgi:hypothetical protein